jgi:6-phosphogluconolactonase/glucosamine-6-phosphate isomerase/deaminase
MTLTLPVLSRARRVLWFVRGAAKARMVRRLVEGDMSIPAGRVEASRALLLLDPAAAAALPSQVTSEGEE